MEPAIRIVIYIHALLGSIGLLAGFGSILFKKGGPAHKRSGIVFAISMGLSAFISLIIARMPGHENNFLFAIGIFTIYMILSGYNVLSFKGGQKKRAGFFDITVSGGMLLVSGWMLIQGILSMVRSSDTGILYIVFGGIGFLLSLGDFQFFRKPNRSRTGWLTSHIGRMCGAFIASVTAFIVAGLELNALVYWIAPTVVGNIYIWYWIKRIKGKAIPSKPIL